LCTVLEGVVSAEIQVDPNGDTIMMKDGDVFQLSNTPNRVETGAKMVLPDDNKSKKKKKKKKNTKKRRTETDTDESSSEEEEVTSSEEDSAV